MERFKGKVAIITGAGDGIGQDTAMAFAREGAHVIVAGRTASSIEETVAQIRQEGGEACAVQTDVSKSSDVENMVAQAVGRYGRLDILFNNAGIAGNGKPLCEIEEEFFEQVWAINTKGTWLGIKYAIPAMLKTGGGCIVNNASTSALAGFPGLGAYASSKHAVIGLTKTAALEYGQSNIRINAVCPSTHLTKLSLARKERLGEEAWLANMRAWHPATGRAGLVHEVSGVVLFLCSEAASNIHGVALPIDGGYSAQ